MREAERLLLVGPDLSLPCSAQGAPAQPLMLHSPWQARPWAGKSKHPAPAVPSAGLAHRSSLPTLALALALALFCSRYLATSVCPALAAMCRGVSTFCTKDRLKR